MDTLTGSDFRDRTGKLVRAMIAASGVGFLGMHLHAFSSAGTRGVPWTAPPDAMMLAAGASAAVACLCLAAVPVSALAWIARSFRRSGRHAPAPGHMADCFIKKSAGNPALQGREESGPVAH